MTIEQEWEAIKEVLEQAPYITPSSIKIARMMFYYGAGVAVANAVKSPMGLVNLAAELRECDLAKVGREMDQAPQ